MQTNVPSATIAFIDEILALKKDGASYRVTGRLVEYDASKDVARIVEGKQGAALWVRTDLLDKFPHKIDSLFQFIGEFRAGKGASEGCLQARCARNVDGLDMRLYREALKLCRKEKKMPAPV